MTYIFNIDFHHHRIFQRKHSWSVKEILRCFNNKKMKNTRKTLFSLSPYVCNPFAYKYFMTHSCQRRTCFCMQAGVNCFIKTVLGGLFFFSSLIFVGYLLMILHTVIKTHIMWEHPNYHDTPKNLQNGNHLIGKQYNNHFYKSSAKTKNDDYVEKYIKLQKQNNTRNYPKSNDKYIPNSKRKLWMRISDEVFVYSAHLDTRNFSTSNPMLNNSSWMTMTVAEGVGAAKERGQRITHDDDDDDSDKLRHVILVRIVGMKTIPPLREFLKGDILDWFRMKNEMEYSQKYTCKLFFTSSLTKNLQSITSLKVTYSVIEEGVKIYAGCYFNCYFAMNSSIFQTIKSSAFSSNLQVSMYPVGVSEYPTKLIEVGTLMMIPGKVDSSNSRSNINYDKKSLAICVRPLFGPFDDLEKLTQFISFYHVMGITRFNFYSMSISSRVRKYFWEIMAKIRRESLKEERKILPRFILHDWNVPTGNTSELWDYGTLAALNDCLFSNVDQEFVIFVDVDEFIVPQKGSVSTFADVIDENGEVDDEDDGHHDNHTSLWTIIDSYNKTKTFQYLIRNTFFCHEFCEKVGNETTNPNMNNKSLDQPTKIVKPETTPIIPASFPETGDSLAEFLREMSIFRCSIRTKRIWTTALRSKYIVNPREVLAVGHHLVTKYVKKVDFRFSSNSVQVDPSIAILNHYRECASISSKKHPVLTRVREIDKTMLMFRRKVFDALLKYYLPKSANSQ